MTQTQARKSKWILRIMLIFLFLLWFINGFFFKVLNFEPRHQQIVGEILGSKHAFILTQLIGISEILLAFWVISGIQKRLVSMVQIVLIMSMNIIEFIVVPELLLFGHFNMILATALCISIYWFEFKWNSQAIGLWPYFKTQPFPVRAFFDYSLVLTFAIPIEQAERLLPAPLIPDTFEDKYAFVAIAFVKCKKLRPTFLPAIFGQDFILTGYRIFSKYFNNENKRLRGLYILQSQTNKPIMKHLGSVFTKYKYQTNDIELEINGNQGKIRSISGNISIDFKESTEELILPSDSVFSTWKEARRFAGPLPFTFSVDTARNQILIIEGVRSNWQPEPVEILNFKLPFLEAFDAKLASAFMVKNIPYSWKKGRTETLKLV